MQLLYHHVQNQFLLMIVLPIQQKYFIFLYKFIFLLFHLVENVVDEIFEMI